MNVDVVNVFRRNIGHINCFFHCIDLPLACRFRSHKMEAIRGISISRDFSDDWSSSLQGMLKLLNH